MSDEARSASYYASLCLLTLRKLSPEQVVEHSPSQSSAHLAMTSSAKANVEVLCISLALEENLAIMLRNGKDIKAISVPTKGTDFRL